ncbi:MAG: long-chain fatty acid--CoA ligase [Bacteroidales bacterium]|nr:long-chain fatty acid--CoA ligase [Bacteroidales bacterium]
MERSLNKMLEESFRKNWDCAALSDFKGITLHYRDVARRIEKLHIIFNICGVEKGDRIAICSRNQANWGVVFLACLTYGAVPVPILHEFKPGNVHHIVNHSDSRVLFVGDVVWENLSESEMPNLEAIILINDFSLLTSKREQITETRERLNEMFGKKYPKSFGPSDINYHKEESGEELAMINYTSGTSGFSKGVMIPYRALLSNVLFAHEVVPNINNKSNIVSMLPTAHMYGMMFEFLFEMTVGAHVHFLTRIPSPRIIMEAFATIKPDVIISVPLIIEKIYKQKLQPILNKTSMKVLLKLPVIDQLLQAKIKDELVRTFGGNFYEIIVGGAAFNKEADEFFNKIQFPYTVGYGMTECAPIISYAAWDKAKLFSCGKPAPRMEIRIASSDPGRIPGEIQVKGANVMLGYYKNEEATAESFTTDGWMRTGDMGIIDEDGYLFIKGRCKSMILGPSGQNIYPEEIESVINNMPYVIESLVIDAAGKLVALVYPDMELAGKDGLDKAALLSKMEENIAAVNADMPNYSKIAGVRLVPEEFEKTPKKSIKRYMYQQNG